MVTHRIRSATTGSWTKLLIIILSQASSVQPATCMATGSSGRGLGEQLRHEFPILDQQINGRRLVYLDNAATSQKPLVGGG